MRFSKRVIVGILIFLLIFTISIVVLGFVRSYEPVTLITAVYGFCTAESGFLALIKNAERKKGKKK